MAFGISAGTYLLAGSALAGGLIAANGSKSAAQAQAASADKAADLNWQQYQQTREDQAPWREAGKTALASLAGGLAPGGDYTKPFSMADYVADPGYQFRLQQGEQGIQRAATARGSRYSGATLKALARFDSDQASQEYGRAYDRYNNDVTTRFNRLASVAGLGQTATAQTSSAGSTAAANTGQAIQNAGTARASGYVGVGNALNGTIGTIANNYQLSQLVGAMKNGGGGSAAYNYTTPEGAVDNYVF